MDKGENGSEVEMMELFPGGPLSNLKHLSSNRLQTSSLVTITVILIGFALHWLRPVLVPLVIAVAVSYIFIPILDLLTVNFKFPKPVAVLVTLALGTAGFGLVFYLILSSVRQLTTKSNIKYYESSIQHVFIETNNWFEQVVNHGANNTLVDLGVDQINELPVGETLITFTNDLIKMLLELSELGVLVLIFTIYILQAYQVKTSTSPQRVGAFGVIENRIKKYLFIKTCLSVLMGVSAGLILLMLGVKYIGIIMLMNFLLNYIPNIGPVVATLIPVPFMVISTKFGWFSIFLAIIMPTVAHFIIGGSQAACSRRASLARWMGAFSPLPTERKTDPRATIHRPHSFPSLLLRCAAGGIMEPQLMGDQLEIHPITVMLGLIFWGMLWGLPGMFMSTPLTALCKICFEHIEFTLPVARLLEGDLSFFTGRSGAIADRSL